MKPEALEEFCRKEPQRSRLLILNYPNNPTGLTLRVTELEGLARVAQKYRLLVLADEIYGGLDHTGQHASIAQYYPEGTIISSGLSKWCGAGGWRLGTFYFPRGLRWLLEAMACIASETYSTVTAPVQYAAVRAFQMGAEIEVYLWQARRILCALGGLVCDRLQHSALACTRRRVVSISSPTSPSMQLSCANAASRAAWHCASGCWPRRVSCSCLVRSSAGPQRNSPAVWRMWISTAAVVWRRRKKYLLNRN